MPLSSSVPTSSSNSWQEDLDQILDVDTSCDSRKEFVKSFASKVTDISADVQSAIQDKDVSKVAPKTLKYGKAFSNFQAFQKQLVSDILPDLLTRGIPKLVDEAPELFNELINGGPEPIFKRGQDLLAFGQELREDASFLQSTVDDVTKELKNIVKSVPEGIDQPAFVVISNMDMYEVRKYEPYSICTTSVESEIDMMEPLASGKSFNTLAGYIFGENTAEEKMSMTTPVIMDGKSMSFILPSTMNANDAPIPKTERISLRDVPSETTAVLDFSGIATEGEVNRQRALLEDALISDGIMYDSSSFRVLQYNPPYTLPWLRKNEVSFMVTVPAAEAISAVVEIAEVISEIKEGVVAELVGEESEKVPDSSPTDVDDETDEFFSSPEAGD